MNTILILLNYNNYSDTELFIDKVINYSEIDKIIVVDNQSPNNSFLELSSTFVNINKVEVISNIKNSGYAEGNNFGIKYALSKYDFKNIIITNPDVEIDESNLHTLLKQKEELEAQENIRVGIVAPAMIDSTTNNRNCGWKMPRYIDDVRSNLMILNKIITVLKKKKQFEDKLTSSVDVVSGAFFVISKEAMVDAGYFDDRTFLYCEERILSFKLIRKGYSNYVLLNCFFKHDSSTTIKSSLSEIRMYKELIRSRKIFQKYYLNINRCQKIVFELSTMIGLLERLFYFSIKKYLYS